MRLDIFSSSYRRLCSNFCTQVFPVVCFSVLTWIARKCLQMLLQLQEEKRTFRARAELLASMCERDLIYYAVGNPFEGLHDVQKMIFFPADRQAGI